MYLQIQNKSCLKGPYRQWHVCFNIIIQLTGFGIIISIPLKKSPPTSVHLKKDSHNQAYEVLIIIAVQAYLWVSGLTLGITQKVSVWCELSPFILVHFALQLWSGADKRTVFVTCICGVVNLSLTPAADLNCSVFWMRCRKCGQNSSLLLNSIK